MFAWLKNRFGSGGNGTTRTLHLVTWEETEEIEIEVVTERLVWSGGAEKVVEHVPEYRDFGQDLLDVDRNVVSSIRESPAYTEEIDSRKETVERSEPKYSWVTEIPPGVEETDRTKDFVEP